MKTSSQANSRFRLPVLALALAGCVLATQGVQANAQADDRERTPRVERAEQRISEMIEGRVAGEPRQCVPVLNQASLRLQVIEHFGVIYRQGSTLWVARAKEPDRLRRDDVPIFQRITSQVCTNDITITVDRFNGFFTGSLILEDFVPYTKPDPQNS